VAANAIYSSAPQFHPCWWASGGLPSAPKAFPRLSNSATMLFTDAYNSSFFTWAEMAANDFLALRLEYYT
jgi:hypothetical protein